jgi:DNA-binding response OmpR family regulator
MMNILLIENDSNMAQVFLNAFTKWKHKSEWSVTGADALERVKQRDFDIILMDIFLPDVHAYELIPQIKRFQPQAGIVTMTDNNSRELELQVRKQGIIFYMVKPFSVSILKKILDHISEKNHVEYIPPQKPHDKLPLLKTICATVLLIFALLINVPADARSEDENIHMKLQRALEEISRLRADLDKIKKDIAAKEQRENGKNKKGQALETVKSDSMSLDLPDGWRFRPYGTIKFDMSHDDSPVVGDNGDYAVWVLPESNNNNSDDRTSFTARQTRLGTRIFAPGIGNTEISGRIEIDFYNPEFAAENKSTIQMRHAYGQITGPDWALLFGQTSDLISPLNPATLNYPVGWFAGNVGYRHPQLKFSKWWKNGQKGTFKIETALSRQIRQDLDGLGVDDGQDAALPSILGRISYSKPLNKTKMELGVSGHYGEEEIDPVSGGNDIDVKTWSVNADIQFPIGDFMEFKGECFWAENFDSYFGGIGQGVNTATYEEIKSVGGWVQLGFTPYDRWAFYAGGGIDNPRDKDLYSGARSRNSFIFGNATYAFAKYLSVGLELSYWKTDYNDNSDGDDIRIQNSWMISF